MLFSIYQSPCQGCKLLIFPVLIFSFCGCSCILCYLFRAACRLDSCGDLIAYLRELSICFWRTPTTVSQSTVGGGSFTSFAHSTKPNLLPRPATFANQTISHVSDGVGDRAHTLVLRFSSSRFSHCSLLNWLMGPRRPLQRRTFDLSTYDS